MVGILETVRLRLGRPQSWGLTALVLATAVAPPLAAQEVPQHAQDLSERLVSVALPGGATQQGVLSTKIGAPAPTHLAVLLPGAPSVVRPVVEGESMVRSSRTGNFLIRARRHLAGGTVATLIVDCRGDQGAECSAAYQASPQRYQEPV